MGQLYAGLARLSGLSTSATANVAQDAGLSFNDILQAYVIERFLTRLARSPHVDTVLPKGALMFEKGNEARGPSNDASRSLALSPGPIAYATPPTEKMPCPWRGFRRAAGRMTVGSSVDLNASWHRFRLLRNRDGEHTVLAACIDLLSVDGIG